MKKYILSLLLMCMLMPLNVSAQSSMSDNQVLEFVMKEHKRGTSQAQIVTKLMQRGVNINQIRRVKAMAENMQKGGNTQLATTKPPPTTAVAGTTLRKKTFPMKP